MRECLRILFLSVNEIQKLKKGKINKQTAVNTLMKPLLKFTETSTFQKAKLHSVFKFFVGFVMNRNV